jgi:hypothetical protein
MGKHYTIHQRHAEDTIINAYAMITSANSVFKQVAIQQEGE